MLNKMMEKSLKENVNSMKYPAKNISFKQILYD